MQILFAATLCISLDLTGCIPYYNYVQYIKLFPLGNQVTSNCGLRTLPLKSSNRYDMTCTMASARSPILRSTSFAVCRRAV